MKSLLLVLRLLGPVILLSSLAVCGDVAAQVELNLRVPKKVYQVGETIRFELVFSNSSNNNIKLLPEPKPLPASVIRVETLDGRRVGDVIAFGDGSIDFEAWSKEVVVVKARKTFSRRYDVKVASSLPPSYDDKRKGLFLWFDGSNIQLPAVGKYRVVAYYDCGPKHPVERFVPDLWNGHLQSNAVIVEFTKKEKS